MREPPDQTCERAASAKAAPVPHFPAANLSSTDDSQSKLDVQAQKLRRLYCFCHATACTIATLAYGVCR